MVRSTFGLVVILALATGRVHAQQQHQPPLSAIADSRGTRAGDYVQVQASASRPALPDGSGISSFRLGALETGLWAVNSRRVSEERIVLGVVIGAAVGIGAGYLLGSTMIDSRDCSDCIGRGIGALAGAVVGAVIGGLVGSEDSAAPEATARQEAKRPPNEPLHMDEGPGMLSLSPPILAHRPLASECQNP